MKKKRYIWVEGVPRTPDASILTKQEKNARIYDLARRLNVKIGKEEDDNVNSKGK